MKHSMGIMKAGAGKRQGKKGVARRLAIITRYMDSMVSYPV